MGSNCLIQELGRANERTREKFIEGQRDLERGNESQRELKKETARKNARESLRQEKGSNLDNLITH